jgi:hypothetical protein
MFSCGKRGYILSVLCCCNTTVLWLCALTVKVCYKDNDKNCVTVEGFIREDRRVKVCETAEVTGIAKSTVHKIISDLNFRKVSAHWVPKMLTEEHRSKRMAALLENLCCYQDEEESFVESIIMGDEIWVYEFTPESKRNSMTWKHLHSPTTKKFKIESSAKKQ